MLKTNSSATEPMKGWDIVSKTKAQFKMKLTANSVNPYPVQPFSYSLGDAIDWKHLSEQNKWPKKSISYSLGDAIDWKLGKDLVVSSAKPQGISYSLGDAIDWKRRKSQIFCCHWNISYSLGDAIDWKPKRLRVSCPHENPLLLLARGRDRLETMKI